MSFKTILVHLNRKSRSQSVLEPALGLARRASSHVIGIYVRPGIQTSLVADSLPTVHALEAEARAERQEEEEIAATFARMTVNGPYSAEWRAVEPSHSDLASVVLQHAYAAHLVVASQNDPDWDRSHALDFPERLVLESGRPVLVVPYVGSYPEIGNNVVIAWKPGREAARAVFDALPILETAKSVRILQIAERRDELAGAEPAIAGMLARHGLKPEIRTSYAADIGVGDELLSRLADLGADLLVMGAYGHSRLREYVFGGATRQIAQHMTVPTLFSH
jgi:nucleotide-binding universal stress UspA family protein